MITRKTRDQIALMRRAGRVVAEMHEVCIHAAKAGATTLDIDRVAREVIDRRGARSNFLGYHGFPAVVCTSPNDVIVHGIPTDSVVLKDGDILSIDCGAIIEGWHADAAVTVPIGEIDEESQRLIDVTRESLNAAIAQVVEGNRLGDVGAAVEGIAEARRVHGGARVRRPRHRHRDARGAAGSELRAGGARHEVEGRHRVGHRADGQRGEQRDRSPRRRLDRGHPRSRAAPLTSSTPSPSPSTAPKSSLSRADAPQLLGAELHE